MEITLQQLTYAIALEKYGNYGQAAKSVGISQPGLSLQIKNLEEKVGIILFDRADKPIRPTPKGKLFLTRAHLLLTQAKHLEEFMQELEGEVSGEINLGVIPTLAPYFIPLFINDLIERYPKIRLHIKEATTEEIINSLRFGKLHAGIISTPITSSFKFQIQPLFYEKFFLYVSEKHPLFKQEKVAVSEIPMEELWLLREGNCFKDQVNNICQYEQEPINRNFMYECNSIASLCRIVEYQGGITFIPELASLGISSEQEEMLKPIEGQVRVREISMIYLANEVRRKLLQKIAEVALANIPQSMLDAHGKELVETNVIV